MKKLFLSTIEDALKQSRVTIKGYYRQRIIVESKADASPVTEADRMVESQIRHIISQRHPDHSIIGEEHGTHHNLADYTWVIDPIDGTNEFAEHPRHDWAIHIALWEAGELTAASVALPTLGITFDASPAAVVPPSTREKPLLVTSRSRNPYCAVMVANALGCDVARLGSAGAKAMAVVMGEADIYVHDGGMYQWDSAAPSAVAKAAGLHVSRIDGSPLKYNQESLWLPDFLVCRTELAEPALNALNP